LVTVFSLLLGVFGVTLYKFAQSSIETSVAEARSALQQEVAEVDKERRNNFIKVALAEARLLVQLGQLVWINLEEQWRARGYRHEGRIPGFESLMLEAIRYLRDVDRVVEPFPDEFSDLRLLTRVNLAHYLATLNRHEDRKEALHLAARIAQDLETPTISISPLASETVAWVYLRFSRRSSSRWIVGIEWLGFFLAHPAIDRKLKDEIRAKYNALWQLGLAPAN
jgi:hypothetical protein